MTTTQQASQQTIDPTDPEQLPAEGPYSDFQHAVILARVTGSVAAVHNGVQATRQPDGTFRSSDYIAPPVNPTRAMSVQLRGIHTQLSALMPQMQDVVTATAGAAYGAQEHTGELDTLLFYADRARTLQIALSEAIEALDVV